MYYSLLLISGFLLLSSPVDVGHIDRITLNTGALSSLILLAYIAICLISLYLSLLALEAYCYHRLDNTVHIWNMTSDICTAVLRGHTSLVKGVAWDPIGSFMASQSDDKSVIIWRTGDWSLAHRTDGHWVKSVCPGH